jgi:hypothetical protein
MAKEKVDMYQDGATMKKAMKKAKSEEGIETKTGLFRWLLNKFLKGKVK